jgi:hypothetical protein
MSGGEVEVAKEDTGGPSSTEA